MSPGEYEHITEDLIILDSSAIIQSQLADEHIRVIYTPLYLQNTTDRKMVNLRPISHTPHL